MLCKLSEIEEIDAETRNDLSLPVRKHRLVLPTAKLNRCYQSGNQRLYAWLARHKRGLVAAMFQAWV
jgi:hypothetical protein